MNARTKTLFHFTGNKTENSGFNALQAILQDGAFWPHYSLEDVAWLEVPGFPSIACPMVCFCDIPITRLREHTERFGSYGIGLCRETMAQGLLNPILYVTRDSILRDSLKEVIDAIRSNPGPHKRSMGMILLAHCKPLKDVSGAKDFYSECEWRFIPWVRGDGENEFGFFLTEAEFNQPALLAKANKERCNHMLPFWPDDVRYLVVRSRDEVRQVVNFIDSLPSSHSWADCTKVERDMLKTRIIALDDVRCDF